MLVPVHYREYENGGLLHDPDFMVNSNTVLHLNFAVINFYGFWGLHVIPLIVAAEALL